MNFCPQCGTQVQEGAKFCPACGFKIAVVPPQQPYYSANNAPVSPPQPAPPPQYQQPYQQNYQQQYAPPQNNMQSDAGSGLIGRVKGILLSPDTEWFKIAYEMPDIKKILLSYVLILAFIPAISLFIGYGLIGQTMMGYTVRSISGGLSQAVIQLLTAILSVYITALVVNMLAGGFNSVKDYGRSVQLVAYAMTPMWVLGILYILPSLMFLKILAMLAGGVYAIYLMYKGVPVIMKTPSEKAFAYVVVVIIVGIIVMLVVGLILGLIMGLIMTGGAMGYGM